MDFPHMKDTQFPNIDNVDVYKFQNDFDYARWQGKILIKLLNVKWNSDYNDVPGFANDTERDTWFDKQRGVTKTLESAFNITPENSVRIPIPYNDAYTYNYLVVDMPIQTSASQPIDYEDANTRVQRWYYFIDSMTQYAPNTTEVYVTLDAWTTFLHTVSIPYLMLERGHAPMFQTKVDTFLSNPIENNEYLLADDFNYGLANRVVKNSTYLPVGNGRKYVLFALPMTQAQMLSVGGADLSGNSTQPTFANSDARWGYQIIVNDYEWKYGDVSYANANLPISAFLNEDSVFNGNYVFAVASENAQTFFNELANNCLHLLHAIQGVYVVVEDMISLGTAFSFKGVNIYAANKRYTTNNLKLSKSAFEFDSKYSEIAKLYTYPYSVLEITDDNGFTSEVRIENTGSIQFHKELSIAFPFVRYQCFFTGLNGNGSVNYTWKNLNNSNVSKTMWEDDFSSFMMNWDIPTFAVYASQEQEYAVNNYASMQARRTGAIVDYENSVRFGNTNRENTADTMATNTANVNRTGATQQYIAGETNTSDSWITNVHNGYIDSNTEKNNNKIQSDGYSSAGLCLISTDIENDTAAASTSISAAASIAGGIATGNVAGVAGGLMNAAAAGAQAYVTVSKNSAIAEAYSQANVDSATMAAATNLALAANLKNENTDVTNNRNVLRTGITNSNVATNNSNASATQGTETANATYSRNANVEAAKSNLIQAQREAAAQYANNRLGKPTLQTEYSGDAYPDVFERRGVRFNIRTQTKAAIAQTGDAFLRFGYALHRVWDMSNGFHYGKHFTYWKAEDVWINDGEGLAGNSVSTIKNILMAGTTVWKNPDEIGTLSIYDNI